MNFSLELIKCFRKMRGYDKSYIFSLIKSNLNIKLSYEKIKDAKGNNI